VAPITYVSTRGAAPELGFADVLLAGLAIDGGLYVPSQWPSLTVAAFERFASMSYSEIATEVMWPFVEGSIDQDAFAAIVTDAYAMLAPALADPDPVIVFEHGALYPMRGALDDPSSDVDISSAAVRRSGDDVTVVTHGGSLPKALEAAERCAADGIGVEVIDLRVLRPLDTDTVVHSVTRTHRAVVVDDGWRSVGLSAEVAARIYEQAFYELDAPVVRVCAAEVPVPYPAHLEFAALPQVDDIVGAVRTVVG
jgi:pyruvate/2-oxoglutarate/acetoin dehydrogenase E1 component